MALSQKDVGHGSIYQAIMASYRNAKQFLIKQLAYLSAINQDRAWPEC
jgi:hypothetical protein